MTGQARRTIWALLLTALVTASPKATLARQDTACTIDVFVQPGDTMSAIAGRTLNSSNAYPAIVAATNSAAEQDSSYATIVNPAAISVGWKLCIPSLAGPPALTPTAIPQVTPMSATNSDEPGEPVPWVIDLAPGELHPLAIERMREQEYPGSELVVEQVLAPGTNYDRSVVSYQSEGNKNFALLTTPQGEMPETGWPVIVFNHGYIPPEQYRTTERYVAYVDGFARNGYMVLRPDYRGHGSSEGEPTGGYSTPDYSVDVLNAVSAIKAHPMADPDRLGMWGHSMGGQITLRSMVTTGDIKAGVIWAGVVAAYPDIIFNWHRDGRYPIPSSIPRRALRWRTDFIEAFGSPEENPDFWASISPNTYVSDLSGPIQLHHGTADSSVPPEFSAQLAEEIEAADGGIEHYVYEGDNHNLSANFGTAMARSIAFFDEHVK